MTTVHLLLPHDIDEPARPSGGNAYDRRVARGLEAAGWRVRETVVNGPWPRPDARAQRRLHDALARLPDDGVVLADGLLAASEPATFREHAHRLRIVVLVHLPLGAESSEREILAAATAVLTTSAWTRDWLLEHYELDEARVHVAPPGVDPAPPATASATGDRLLYVGAVSRVKGLDVLVESLAQITELPWRLTVVGSGLVEPAYTAQLRIRVRALGLEGRIGFTGPLDRAAVGAAYQAADVLLVPSRQETYGLAVTEALAHGLPVLASRVGGVAESLGRAPDGQLPGLLIPVEDESAWGSVLTAWLTDEPLRERLRRAAAARRPALPTWNGTTEVVSRVLEGVARRGVRA